MVTCLFLFTFFKRNKGNIPIESCIISHCDRAYVINTLWRMSWPVYRSRCVDLTITARLEGLITMGVKLSMRKDKICNSNLVIKNNPLICIHLHTASITWTPLRETLRMFISACRYVRATQRTDFHATLEAMSSLSRVLCSARYETRANISGWCLKWTS